MKYLLVAVVVFGLALFLLTNTETNSVPSVVSEVVNEAVPSAETVEVYDGILIPVTATELDLSSRGLTGSLKAEVRHLSQLRVLDVSNNDFTGLPAEVGQLSQLRVLNLSHNPFTGLPHELGNLSNLSELDLRGTNYAPADLAVIKQSLPDTVTILTD